MVTSVTYSSNRVCWLSKMTFMHRCWFQIIQLFSKGILKENTASQTQSPSCLAHSKVITILPRSGNIVTLETNIIHRTTVRTWDQARVSSLKFLLMETMGQRFQIVISTQIFTIVLRLRLRDRVHRCLVKNPGVLQCLSKIDQHILKWCKSVLSFVAMINLIIIR